MSIDGPIPEVQSPAQRGIVVAAVACFFSLMLFFCISRPVVGLLDQPWAELLIYATLPLGVTFAVLRHSAWRVSVMACLAWICVTGVPVGSGMR